MLVKILSHEIVQRTFTALMLGTFFIGVFFFLPPWCFSLTLCAALIYAMLVEMPRLIPYKGIPFLIMTFFYPIIPFFILIALNQHEKYRLLILIAVLAVCSNDIGAYCAGKLWGKHKIFPKISPKKTWEGFFGGFAATMFAFVCFEIIMHKKLDVYFLIIMSFLFSTIATSGDFFESWLKRKARIKDSGSLLPGHGGLLDRVDSLLFVIMFVFFCRDLLLKKLL